ncbi:MAG TPA: F0F1 ATP synthase subunit B [Acidimicrobiales bacterium]|nr:F0F1 ATP synthase subunit B [Acidimicrobiales bacterium]
MLHTGVGLHAGAAVLAGTSVTTTTSTPIFIVPNGTFFVELIIFIVVLGVMARFVLPPIQRVMSERETRIRAGHAAGDEGRAEADRLARERTQLLDGARSEARGLIEAASRAADAAFEDARRRGSAEHDRLLEEARPGLEAERQRLEDSLRVRLGDLVVGAASQVIGERVELSPHRALVDALARRAEGRRGDGAGGVLP